MRAVAQAGLTEAQRAATSHPGGALMVTGGAGSGKTTVLAHRFAWLASGATTPERLLMLVHSPLAREKMCELLGELVEPPYEELHVQTFDELCRTLLADEALEAGLDPLFVPVTRADRVALLLDRLGDLTLRQHEIRGNPAPLLASFVERIDRLKEEMVSPQELLERTRQALAAADGAAEGGSAAAVGEGVSDAARTLAAREVEFAQLYADHDRLLAERGALDSGDLFLTAFRLLHERPHVRERAARRFAHVLVDEYQEATFAQGMVLRLLCEEHGQITVAGDDGQTLRRFGHVGGRNLAEFPREYSDVTTIELGASQRCPAPIAQVGAAVASPAGGTTATLEAAGAGLRGRDGVGDVSFWRCSSERAQAQAVALHVERLIGNGANPAAIAVLVRSAADDGTVVGGALEQRAIPFRVRGPGAYFQRAEVRDVLAWLRVLADPGDSGAAVRALTRPPIGLHSVDIARLTQLARRRKFDMPSAVAAALEGPQLSPEGRDRAQVFLELYRAAGRAFESRRPDAFVLRLIERVGIRRQQVFATQADTVERLRNIARLPELATTYMRREPNATPRDFTRYLKAVADSGLPEAEATGPAGAPAVNVLGIADAKGDEFDHVFVLGLSAARMPGRAPAAEGAAAVASPTAALGIATPAGAQSGPPTHEQLMRRRLHIALTRPCKSLVLSWSDAPNGSPARPSPFYEEARSAAGAPEERFEEELFGPAEGLHSTFRIMRDELLDTISRVGGRLGEMRLDTTLDVSQAVARYLELLKVAALIERSKDGQPLDDAISEVNQLLAAGASAEQRAVLESSALDDWLRDAGRDPDRRPVAGDDDAGPSLDPFIPRRRGAGAPENGLMLSASDIETYRLCPLKYKFGRVFRIPQESTIHQRFGIALHTVLERFHKLPDAGREQLFELFESSWRRGGFGESDDELQFRERGVEALERYWENTRDQEGEPVWFERSFSFGLGPHVIRGRVDRVDRRPDGSYEVIDYKTGRSKTAAELQSDVQLSIYQMGARESWGVETSAHSYYYVMTAEKVPVAHSDEELDRVRATIEEIGAGISRQDFQPTPTQEICSFCDFRIICPAAER